MDCYLKARVVWIFFAFSVIAPTSLHCRREIGRRHFVVVAGNLKDSLGRGQKNMKTALGKGVGVLGDVLGDAQLRDVLPLP